MDKHICKAKSMYEDEWVYGYLIIGGEEYKYINQPELPFSNVYITNQSREIYTDYHLGGSSLNISVPAYHVIPNTVCRNTGMTEFVMTDRSVCAPLFEGDIVEVWSRRRPYGESITLYRDYTTSQYDAEVKARAVICFKRGQWCLDYDNAYNKAICELKGNEQSPRTVKASPYLYDFGVHRSNAEWFIEHNQRCKWYDIVRIGNIHDNPELLEG